jgi:thiamine biosynthesis lipoprotein
MNATFKWLLGLGALITSAGCNQPPAQEFEISGPTQGTQYHIKWTSQETSPTPEQLQSQIESQLASIDLQMSNYRDDSEISKLNQQETTDWLPISTEILGLLRIADSVYQDTDGCYDLTIKPLLDLWGFSKHQNTIPSDTQIMDAKRHIGMNLLEIDDVNHRIRKKDPKLKIDLSSIAQGYSTGVLAQLLESFHLHNYMVEIGGEMVVNGHKGNGEPWRIGIEKPIPNGAGLQKLLTVTPTQPTAIMTAGTYRNYFEVNGIRYSHIINPVTGKPVTHTLRSVTLIHEDPTVADAWDTALLCIGAERSLQVAEKNKLKLVLLSEQNSEITESLSSAFTLWQTPSSEP